MQPESASRCPPLSRSGCSSKTAIFILDEPSSDHTDSSKPAPTEQLSSLQARSSASQPTIDNIATCHLLNLTAELRNAIYHLVLVAYNLATQPSLLRTCRQIRNEATAIFYGGNVFQSNRRGPVIVWLGAIGAEKRRMVQQIRGFAVDSPWSTVVRAKGRARWFERHMKGLGMSIRKGVIRAPCVEAEWPGMMKWVDGAGNVVAETKTE
ncbi:hypothetical protein LTR36_009141 [Oleoguttula mirabilis]|uniref:Uncharacterized protein n=1 Tax=Oleoguttula mirabilis TaxID=1507867 RepID=A0AAV9J6Z3_9PEZI|nr:hypothetical protein LTR36_009141 [Oleoguttula mirabilis]